MCKYLETLDCRLAGNNTYIREAPPSPLGGDGWHGAATYLARGT
jgi:hypothetical protein